MRIPNPTEATEHASMSEEMLRCYGGSYEKAVRARDRANWRAHCRNVVTVWFQTQQSPEIEDAKARLVRAYQVKPNNTLAIPLNLSEYHMLQLAGKGLLPMPPHKEKKKSVSDEQRQKDADAAAMRWSA